MPARRLALAALLLAGSVCLPALASAQPTFAQPAPGLPAPALHVTGSGEFVARRDLGPREADPRDPGPAAQGSDAVVMVEDPRIVTRTNRIEARLCRRFGFMFTLENPGPSGMLDVTVTSAHPPITHPDGRVSTGVAYPMLIGTDKPGLVGFSFDDPWELVAGTWTFTVRAGGRVLTEQKYDVTVPEVPDPSAARGDCSAVVS